MNIENYIERLSGLQILSSGLKAYISTIAKEERYTKGQRILHHENSPAFYPLVVTGAIRLLAIDNLSEAEISLGFYFENDFLYHLGPISLVTGNLLIMEFIEDTALITISENHYSNVLKLFPEAYLLSLRFTSFHLGSVTDQLYIRNHYQASDRYSHMLKLKPEIARRVTIKNMATFLGVDQTTLSRIRAKK